MSKFKFSEKERENIRSVIRSDADWEGVFDRIEQIVSERDGWIDVKDVTELHKLHWCEIQNEPPSENTSTILLGYKATYGGSWNIYWLDGLSSENPARPIIRVSPLTSPPKQPTK